MNDSGKNMYFEELRELLQEVGTAPSFSEMPRRRLEDKGVAGPTAAHVIEELHVPFNYEGVTFTTGSSAFQNVVGITKAEMPRKIAAGQKVLEMAEVGKGSKVLFCYPPLVNVFSKQCLSEWDLEWGFLYRSSRDAFLTAVYFDKPDAIMGESSFIRAALEDAIKLGIAKDLPTVPVIMTAGTPMDLDLPEIAENVLNSKVYDVYGCQEFGWLTVNGVPVREDISLIPSPLGGDYCEVLVGGLPMGDSFPAGGASHLLNKEGKIITYKRKRTRPDYEVVVMETPINDIDTIERATRTILRTKARVVHVHPEVQLASDRTVLGVRSSLDSWGDVWTAVISGPDATQCFDDLVRAQVDYQENAVTDPAWIKKR